MNKTIFNKAAGVILLLLLLGSIKGFCAQEPFNLKPVSAEDLKMKVYAKDTSAVAVVLHDEAETSFLFNTNTQVQFRRTIRIKILKKAGIDEANLSIPYYKLSFQRKEDITEVEGATYNLEGATIAKDVLEKKSIFAEQQDGQLYLLKMAMPNVKVGSVVELSYTLVSDFILRLPEWQFQKAIPVQWSEYRVNIVPFYGYKQVYSGNLPFHIKESKDFEQKAGYNASMTRRDYLTLRATQYRWVMKDVPAFVAEPFLGNPEDFIPKLELELATIQYPDQEAKYVTANWKDFTNEMLKDEDFGLQLSNNTGFLKKEANALVAGKTDSLEKAQAIWEHVKNHMTWNARHRVFSHNLKEAWEQRKGSSADINLLLVAALRHAGLLTKPVLLSTRQHGKPMVQSPMISKFNYVIALVNIGGKDYFLDATDKDLGFAALPKRCLNEQGWVFELPAGRWVPLKGADRNLTLYMAQLEVSPKGEVKGTMEENYLGLEAHAKRITIRENGQEKYLQKLASGSLGWERKDVSIENIDNLQSPLQAKYTLSRTGESQPGNLLYLSPMQFEGLDENPFKSAVRQYPVDFVTPQEETYVVTYKLPEGYDIEGLPEAVAWSLPNNTLKYSYAVQKTGNQLQIKSKLNINKAIFTPEEYSSLREIYGRIAAKHAEKVVLKKKS